MKLATNSTSPSKMGKEYELGSLPIGSRFQINPLTFEGRTYGEVLVGTLIDVTTGRAVVRLDGGQKKVKIHDSGTGKDAEFDARSRSTSYALDTAVEPLNEIVQDVVDEHDRDKHVKQLKSKATTPTASADSIEDTMARTAAVRKSTSKSTTTKKSRSPKLGVIKGGKTDATATVADSVATTPTTPKAKALMARWTLAVTRLSQLLSVDTASSVVDEARAKVQEVYDAAVSAGVTLPSKPITVTDPVYLEMKLGNGTEDEAQENASAAAEALGTGDGPTAQGKAKKAGRRAAGKAGSTTKKSTPRSKAAENDCLDGCGAKVAGRFKQGHDARYRSLILQVEREELAENKLPALMRKSGGKNGEALNFKKVSTGYKCTNSVLAH